MKKTLTVNLGGSVFHIDEDAYRLLDNYLRNLKLHFRKQEGAEEIVHDIETRISELFAEKLQVGLQVITLTEAEEVILRMGKPEEFDSESGSENSSAHTSTTSNQSASTNSQSTSNSNSSRTSTSRHRLFRDPDDKILGGVASGLAAYLDWDPTLMRALFIILLILPYCPMLIVYIIAWIVIPQARTAADKLNMRGQAVTVENIGKTVTDGFEKVANGVNDYMKSDKPRTLLQKIGDGLVQVAGVLLKALMVIFAVIFSPVLFVLILVFVMLLILFITMIAGGGAYLFSLFPMVDWAPLATVSPLMTVGGSMAGIALVTIPILSLLYVALQQGFNWSPIGSGMKWTLFILWIISLAVFLINLSALGGELPLYGIHSI